MIEISMRNLRQLLQDAEIRTIKEFASRSGLNRATISRMFKRGKITLRSALKVAKCLHVNINEFAN